MNGNGTPYRVFFGTATQGRMPPEALRHPTPGYVDSPPLA